MPEPSSESLPPADVTSVPMRYYKACTHLALPTSVIDFKVRVRTIYHPGNNRFVLHKRQFPCYLGEKMSEGSVS